MAVTQAELGYGTVLKFEATADSGTYTTIEEMQDGPEFGDDIEMVEASHQESPSRRKEYIAGWLDAAELAFAFQYIKSATQDAVRAALGTVRNFRYVFSTDTPITFTFPALILKAKLTAPMKEKKMFMLSIKPTGTITES